MLIEFSPKPSLVFVALEPAEIMKNSSDSPTKNISCNTLQKHKRRPNNNSGRNPLSWFCSLRGCQCPSQLAGSLVRASSCEQNTLTRHIFSCFFHSTHFNVAHDIGSRWLSASRHPSFMRSVCSDLSSTLHFALFTVSLIFLFILLIFVFIFHVGRFGEKSPVRFRE